MSRWRLPSSVTARPSSPVRVVPLSRWPFADATALSGRLTMDGMVVDRAATRNEYVEGPSAVDPRRRRVGRKTAAGPAAPSAGVEASEGDSPTRRRRGGLAVKVRRLLSCVGTSPTSSTNQQADRLARCVGPVCGRCGRCGCGHCEQSSTLRRARSVVDVVSCMCCVRSLFYHCLRDDAGDELHCSDEPCACSGRPHCAARWALMVALLPCLPCLCLYLPLRCTVDAACGGASPGSVRSCHCSGRTARHPGLKGLLESESSST